MPSTVDLSGPLLDVHNWEYIAEGAKNLVVSYTGPPLTTETAGLLHSILRHFESGIAMRLVKRDLADEKDAAAPLEDDAEEDEADEFRVRVIEPLLYPVSEGSDLVSPYLPYICSATVAQEAGGCSAFIAALSNEIEPHRPATRRAVSTIDTRLSSVRLTENLAGNGQANEDPAAHSVSFEIKPKWGFLPSITSGVKGTQSRYRMHRVLKTSQSKEGPLSPETFPSIYDPLDLYSPREADRRRAIESLVMEWLSPSDPSNNLRVFCAGSMVDPSKPSELKALSDAISSRGMRDNYTDIVNALFKALSTPASATGSSGVMLFHRLARLQSSLDGLDVEHLATRWKQETGRDDFGGLHEPGKTTATPEVIAADENSLGALIAAPTVDEYEQVVKAWLAQPGNETESESAPFRKEGDRAIVRPTEADRNFLLSLTLRQAVLAYLLSATFKDCSVFISISPGASTSFKVVDLDPKPLGRMPHYLALDRKIVAHFEQWTQTNPDVLSK